VGETLSRGGADFTGLGVLVYDQNSPQHRAIPAAEAQGWVNNRSVMPLDAVRLHARYNGGSQTCAAERFRYYMGETPPRLGLYRVKPATNKEFLVSAGHNPAEISFTNPRLSASGGVSAVNAVGASSGVGSSAPGPIGLGNL
jgi:hypothetical protein